MSKFALNGFNTTDLTLNVMESCADHFGLDIHDDEVANRLYWTCCDLESFPEDQGFGGSDHYGYFKSTAREFNLPF